MVYIMLSYVYVWFWDGGGCPHGAQAACKNQLEVRNCLSSARASVRLTMRLWRLSTERILWEGLAATGLSSAGAFVRQMRTEGLADAPAEGPADPLEVVELLRAH